MSPFALGGITVVSTKLRLSIFLIHSDTPVPETRSQTTELTIARNATAVQKVNSARQLTMSTAGLQNVQSGDKGDRTGRLNYLTTVTPEEVEKIGGIDETLSLIQNYQAYVHGGPDFETAMSRARSVLTSHMTLKQKSAHTENTLRECVR